MNAVVLEVANAEEQEGHVECEEEEEEGDGGAERADEKEEREDEPSHQVQAEGVEEGGFADINEGGFDLEAAWCEDDGE
jgi:hypothetical protein